MDGVHCVPYLRNLYWAKYQDQRGSYRTATNHLPYLPTALRLTVEFITDCTMERAYKQCNARWAGCGAFIPWERSSGSGPIAIERPSEWRDSNTNLTTVSALFTYRGACGVQCGATHLLVP